MQAGDRHMRGDDFTYVQSQEKGLDSISVPGRSVKAIDMFWKRNEESVKSGTYVPLPSGNAGISWMHAEDAHLRSKMVSGEVFCLHLDPLRWEYVDSACSVLSAWMGG